MLRTRAATLFFCLAISIVVFATNFPIVDCYFCGDPLYYVRPGTLSQIGRMYLGQDMPARYYRPSHRALFNIQYPIFDKRPEGYHLTDIVILLSCTLALFLLVRSLCGNSTLAAASALIFATHPAHAAVIRAMDTRHYSLETLVQLGAFYLLARAMFADGKTKHYIAGLALLAFAFTFDAMAITLPAIVVLYELIAKRPPTLSRHIVLRRAKEYLPIFLLAAGYAALRYHLIEAPGPTLAGGGQVQRFGDIAFALRNLRIYIGYLTKPLPPSLSLPVFVLVCASAIFVGSSISRFFLAWTFVSLLPVHHLWFERATFLSSVGWSVVLAWFITSPLRRMLARLARYAQGRHEGLWPKALSAGIALLGLALLAWFGSTETIDALLEYKSNVYTSMLIPRKIAALRPGIPSKSTVYLVGNPIGPDGMRIIKDEYTPALTFIYSRLIYSDTFAGFLERFSATHTFDPKTTYFFEYRDGNVIERLDLKRLMIEKMRIWPSATRHRTVWDLAISDPGRQWTVVRPSSVARSAEGLCITTSGEDCIVESPNSQINPLAISVISVRLKVWSGKYQDLNAQLCFFSRKRGPEPSGCLQFHIFADGSFHNYQVEVGRTLEWLLAGTVSKLQIRIPASSATILIQRVEALPKDLGRGPEPMIRKAVPQQPIMGTPGCPLPYALPYYE